MYLLVDMYMALGDRLKTARKSIKMTQKQLADKAGVSQGLISDLENNVYPTSAYVPKLASILNVDALYLADGVVKFDKRNKRETDKEQLTISGVKIDTFEEQLLSIFNSLSEKKKDLLLLMANKLHDMEFPEDAKSNPTGYIKDKTQ